MQSFKEVSDRTKRRKIAAAVSKLLNEIDSTTDDTTIKICSQPEQTSLLLSSDVIDSISNDQDICGKQRDNVADDCVTHDVTNSTISHANDELCINSDSADEDLCVIPPYLFCDNNSLDLDFVADVSDDSAEWTPQVVNNDSDDECDENSACETELSDKAKLAQWAVTFNISQRALSALLAVLQTCDESQLKNLPKDARTLLLAERHIDIDSRAGGDYYYFGIRYWLSVLLQRFPQAFNGTCHIDLIINVDGIPLFNSSKVALWPILGSVKNADSCPFPIAVYCSKNKPTSVSDYLKDFIAEMQCLETVGFHSEGRHFTVALHAIICDAPARAYLKCVKTHSGYESCERCCQHGEWYGKVTFPELSAQPRTDLNFRNKEFPGHHLMSISSPLLELKSCGLVTSVPLDYMHLVCLGVMRRLLCLWIHGPRSTKLSQSQLTIVSGRLVDLQCYIPREFARKPRSLLEYKTWKATELRLFLLYCGPLVLKGILPDKLYEDFLAFSAAIRILLTQGLLKQYLVYAEDLLKYFVHEFGVAYGEDQLVYNVHSLTHLADDAKKYGTLDSVSAFQFESYLGRLKKLVRRPQQPCTQIVRRLLEGHCQPTRVSTDETGMFKGSHMEGPLPMSHVRCSQFKKYYSNSSFNYMSINTGDNCFEIGGKLGLVRNILKEEKGNDCCGYVVFEEFTVQNAFFINPLNSQSLSIFHVDRLSTVHTVLPLNISVKKFVLLPFKSGYVALPQMHNS